MWPAKTSSLPVADAPRRIAQRFVTRAVSGPKGNEVQAKPIVSRRAAISAWQPPSSGVTERREISCSARSSVADIGAGLSGTAAQKRRTFGETPMTSSGRTSIVISVKLGWSESSSFFGTILDTGDMSFCRRHIRLVGESA